MQLWEKAYSTFLGGSFIGGSFSNLVQWPAKAYVDMTGGFALMNIHLNTEYIDKIGEETFKNFLRQHLKAGTGAFTTWGADSDHGDKTDKGHLGLIGAHAYRTG